MEKRNPKVLGKQDGGPEPGYRWHCLGLDECHDDAKKKLTDAEHGHVKHLARTLAQEQNPTHSELCDVKAIEDFFELRDKGGVLGKKNIRLFFGMDKKRGAIVLLGLELKKNDGATLQSVKIKIRRRWRKYLQGEYDEPNL